MTVEKEDPIKIHKQGNMRYDMGNYKEAGEKFLIASKLYEKKGNYFDASNMMFKAGECSFLMEDYKTAVDLFKNSSEVAFSKGFDRFGVSALEYLFDCYKALKKEKSNDAKKLKKRIKEIKKKLAAQLF